MKYLKQNWLYGIGALASGIGLGYLIWYVNPENTIFISSVSVSPILLFFVALGIFLVTFGTYLSKNLRRGLLLGLFGVGIFLLRFFGFNDILYIVLWLALIILIEAFFFKKPERKENHTLESSKSGKMNQ